MIFLAGPWPCADGNTLVVGAVGEASAAIGVNPTFPAGGQGDNTASYAGAAYMYTRGDASLDFAFRDYIKAPNGAAGDVFGGSLALSADGNTFAVSAIWEDSAATGIGGNMQDDCIKSDGTTNTTPNNCASESGAVYLY